MRLSSGELQTAKTVGDMQLVTIRIVFPFEGVLTANRICFFGFFVVSEKCF